MVGGWEMYHGYHTERELAGAFILLTNIHTNKFILY
jgi:hypothetical protein